MTDEQVAVARRMLADKVTLKAVAEHFGVSDFVIRKRTDPAFAERRRQQVRAARALRGNFIREKGFSHSKHVMDRDVRARFDEIPQDTRTLTARCFGDPLPGRSALDMRAAQA